MMSPRFKYQDFVDEQQSGVVHGVFIDDTGSPGLQDTPAHLHSERKSWIAVLVPRTDLPEVWSQIPEAIDELTLEFGAQEFHFADIYAGRREFKSVPLPIRLSLFEFMAQIFSIYRFPVMVQTLDPDSLKNVRSQGDWPERLGPFNFEKHEDLALFFLLLRIKWYLQENYAEVNRLASVFVDEGFKKNGVVLSIPKFETVFTGGLVSFARSDSILPLQLADFAAFSLNRSQLLIGKSELSEIDEHFLRIISPLAWNFQNIPVVKFDSWFSRGDSLNH